MKKIIFIIIFLNTIFLIFSIKINIDFLKIGKKEEYNKYNTIKKNVKYKKYFFSDVKILKNKTIIVYKDKIGNYYCSFMYKDKKIIINNTRNNIINLLENKDVILCEWYIEFFILIYILIIFPFQISLCFVVQLEYANINKTKKDIKKIIKNNIEKIQQNNKVIKDEISQEVENFSKFNQAVREVLKYMK